MNFDNKYYHGLGYQSKSIIEELKKLELIMKSKSILCKSLQENKITYTHQGFNGFNYISLCDGIKGKYMSHSAYNMFIETSITLILTENTPNIIKPVILPKKAREYSVLELTNYSKDTNSKRYTDLFDEVQVKDKISIENVIGIGFPVDYYLTRKRNKITVVEYYLTIKEILKQYNYNFDIYDINQEIKLDDEVVLKKLAKYNKK